MVDVSVPGMLTLLGATMPTVCGDEARVNLCGMFIESDGKHATSVSTDGHRLSVMKMELAGPKLERSIIIPRVGLLHLKHLLGRARAETFQLGIEAGGTGWLFARQGTLALSIKLNNVVFPPYQQVVPKEAKSTAVLDRLELMTVLRRCLTLAPEKTGTPL